MQPWTYDTVSTEGGTHRSVSIASLAKLDADGTGLRSARLVFSDDPTWGYSALLVLESGEFDCDTGCRVRTTMDGGPERDIRASRPESSPSTLSLRDPRRLWHDLRGVRILSVDFATRARGVIKASFDVSGIDRSKLDWDQHRRALPS